MNGTEESTRRLLAMASEDIPAGVDLLSGLRIRQLKRARQRRVAVAVASAAAAVAVATAVTLTVIPAPSASAQVKKAAAATASTSYTMRASGQILVRGGLRSPQWSTASGRFDPASSTGEVSDDLGAQVRSTGGSTYIFLTDSLRDGYAAAGQPIPAWASWERLPLEPGPGTRLGTAGLSLFGRYPALLGAAGPQDLLRLLQSATQVREVGPVSGPGWTGTEYSFRAAATLNGTLRIPVSSTGTVDVDQQGLVRRLDTRESFEGTVRHITITFGDFGLPVTVSPPPASETWTPPA